MTHARLQRIAVVGLGLLGGSLVQSLKRALPQRKIIGVDYPHVLAQARDFLDEQYAPTDLSHALANADLIFLATPINAIIDMLPLVANAVKRGAIITDVGSTKFEIVEKAKSCFGEERFFIGGHPMTGLEKGGWENAQPNLFDAATYVLTPMAHCPVAPRTALQGLLQTIGARVLLLEAEEHDHVAAEVSHLPQLLAVALTNFIAREGIAQAPRMQMAAGGFRDMTRIAASPYNIWCDILQTNHKNVREALREFTLALQELDQNLEEKKLEGDFQRAHAVRQQLALLNSTIGQSFGIT